MIKKEKIKDLHYIIDGVIGAADIRTTADEILQKQSANAKIPGFRAGHVPVNILRQKFDASAIPDAVDQLLNADMNKYLDSKKIRLAGTPKADVKKYEPDADLEYNLEFDILPILPEIELEKMTVTKKVAKVEKSEIDRAFENLRKGRAQFEKQDEKYCAADGDAVMLDFKGFVGADAFEGGEGKNHRLVIGSKNFIPGFEEAIVGHKSAEEFSIDVKFPSDYHAENLAGKKAKFEIKIHEIRRAALPELNDAFAKEIGFDNLEKLREHIAEILSEQYADAAQREMREELLDILAEKVKMDLPDVLVDQEVQMARDEFEKHAGHEHAKGEKFDEKAERRDAERRVKLGLILAEWGQQNKIAVTPDEMQKAIWSEASAYPDPQQVFQFYNQNPNAMSMVRGMLFERKSLDAMLTHVKIKEKSVKPDDLFQQK